MSISGNKKPGFILILISLFFLLPALAWSQGRGETTANVNLREGPGTQYKVIKTIPAGSVINFLPDKPPQNNWGFVQVGKLKGWMYAKYIKALLDTPKIPSSKSSHILSNVPELSGIKNQIEKINSFPATSILIFTWVPAGIFFLLFLITAGGNFKRIFIALSLVCFGAGFMGLQFKQTTAEPKEKTSWSYKVSNDRHMPAIRCEAGVPYSFKADGYFYKIRLNGIIYPLERIGKEFYIIFNKPTTINYLGFKWSDWTSSGHVWIEKNAKNGRQVVLIPNDKYSEVLFTVHNGMRFDISWPDNPYIVGWFQDNNLKEKNKAEENNHYFRACDTYDIKIKSLGSYFLMAVDPPYKEPLRVKSYTYVSRSDGTGHSSYETRELPQLYFLKKGEVKKTPFWLDKNDTIKCGSYCYSKDWAGQYAKWRKADVSVLGQPGYVSFKANKETFVSHVSIVHKDSWHFNLKKDQVRKVKIYPGDLIKSFSEQNYYLDGRIMEPKTTYNITRGYKTELEFKGAPNTKIVDVWVMKRRGY